MACTRNIFYKEDMKQKNQKIIFYRSSDPSLGYVIFFFTFTLRVNCNSEE